jgi:hypothetical protein
MSCVWRDDLKIEYNGNVYDKFFFFPGDQNSTHYNQCKGFVNDVINLL